MHDYGYQLSRHDPLSSQFILLSPCVYGTITTGQTFFPVITLFDNAHDHTPIFAGL